MKREIKFRGKFTEKSEWKYGYYYNNCDVGINTDFIVQFNETTGTGDHFPIDVRFLGQFTGLHDRNGKEIYEGDILSEKWRAEVYRNNEGTFMVKFHNNPLGNKPRSLFNYLQGREKAGTSETDCAIIGNLTKALNY